MFATNSVVRRVDGDFRRDPLSALGRMGRDLTAGLLPAPIRRQYGLSWTPVQAVALDAACAASRPTLPDVPAAVRYSHHS